MLGPVNVTCMTVPVLDWGTVHLPVQPEGATNAPSGVQQ